MKRENVKLRHDDEVKGQLIIPRVGKTIYVTERNPETFVKKYNGFGISLDIIDQIRGRADAIRIVYHGERGTVHYQANLRKWLKKGVEDELGGFERQVFMKKDWLKEVKPGGRQTSLGDI